jgi:hypothetical protein
MARWRQAVELAMSEEEIEGLAALGRSRSEAARRVERAQMLLAYRENPSFFAVGQRLGVHHRKRGKSRGGQGERALARMIWGSGGMTWLPGTANRAPR